MEKSMYIIREKQGADRSIFFETIKLLTERIAQQKLSEAITFTITVDRPPLISVIPFKKDLIAVVSIFQKDYSLIEDIVEMPGFSGAFRVSEAIPVSYEKEWTSEGKTPGVNLLTLFRKKPGIPYDTFIDRWHNSHTPMSLKIHPLWNYNRNVVNDSLTDESEEWDGIVEEHFRTRSDLLNPVRFFGNPLIMLYRMLQVYIDTKSFIDYKTIETYLSVEYRIKRKK